MARHSSGENNYRVAKGPFIVVIAIVLIAAAIFAWFNLRSSNNATIDAERANCSQGDMTLMVTTDPAAVGDVQKLVQAYGESKPVVKDHCVRPQISVAGSQEVVDAIAGTAASGSATTPGVWVPADASFVRAAGASGKVKVNEAKAWLRPIRAGVAVKADRAGELKNASWADLAALRVATPGGSDAVLSSMVGDALGGGVEAATARAHLGGNYTSNTLMGMLAQDGADFDAVAATEPMLAMAGEGLTLITPGDGPLLQAPIITFGSGGPIDEMTARAAEDFQSFAASNGADGPALADSALTAGANDIFKALAAIPTDPFAMPPSQGQAGGTQASAVTGSTLVLLDVSDGTDAAALASAVRPVLDTAASAGGAGAGGEGSQGEAPATPANPEPSASPRVALWDYSKRGEDPAGNLRRNVELTDPHGATTSASALQALTSGGQPWLWPALIQAYQYATQNFAPDMPNRIVVVTKGADESGRPPAELLGELRGLIDPARPVKVDIVLLPGGSASSPELNEVTAITGGSLRVAADTAQGLGTQISAAMGS
nr:hypothetical protein [Corynebacterium lactis]